MREEMQFSVEAHVTFAIRLHFTNRRSLNASLHSRVKYVLAFLSVCIAIAVAAAVYLNPTYTACIGNFRIQIT